MTYIATGEGWLYLAAILDLFSRKIVGWAMSGTMPQELTLAALNMAITNRQLGPGLLHHSDRGSQGGLNWSSQHPCGGGCDEHVNQRERGTQKDYRYSTPCCADQRRNPPLTHRRARREREAYLPKPFEGETLARVVHSLLPA